MIYLPVRSDILWRVAIYKMPEEISSFGPQVADKVWPMADLLFVRCLNHPIYFLVFDKGFQLDKQVEGL